MATRADIRPVVGSDQASGVRPAPPTQPGATAGGSGWSSIRFKGLNLPTHKRVVFDILVDMIIQFELLPGERLVESELAARLNVSKTPVREALALLEADGLVETESYKGAKVRWLSRAEMDEQTFLVDALEQPAFPLVIARTTKAEMAAVGRLVDELGRARRRSDGRAYGRLMVEIHQRLFRAAGYPRLEKLITLVVGPLGLRYDRLFVYPFDDAWDTQLSLIEQRYEALRDGDADRAVEVVRRHRAKLRQMSDARLANPDIARHFGSRSNEAARPPSRYGCRRQETSSRT